MKNVHLYITKLYDFLIFFFYIFKKKIYLTIYF